MQPITKKAVFLNCLVGFVSWLIIFGTSILNSLLIRKDPVGQALTWTFVGMGIIIAVIITVMMLCVGRYRRNMLVEVKGNATLFTILTLSTVANVLLGYVHAYAMVVILAGMIASSFFDSRIVFVCNSFSVILLLLNTLTFNVALGQPIDMTMIAVLLSGFLVGSLITFLMDRDTKRFSFILIGFGLGILQVVITLLFMLLDFGHVGSAIDYAYLAIMAFAPVLFTVICQPLIERLYNLASNFRLIELTDPKSPLMKRLAQEAPGTYNHSLTVANLVSTCANAIGENVYLARAAGYYHDIGKLNNPAMFAENQSDGRNIHDELTPEASTDIIRKHTVYGEQICKEYRIPSEISKITKEHHGSTVIAYFCNKARELTDGREIDIKDYSYTGPTPSTKISALVMICDSCEAAIRAMNKPVAEQVDQVVDGIIDNRLRTGQFDNCPITMQDLQVSRKTIVNAVCGLYHKRIQYPKVNEDER